MIKIFLKFLRKICGVKYVRADFKEDKIGKMKYGLVHVRYCDKKLFFQIRKWTEEYLSGIGIN